MNNSPKADSEIGPWWERGFPIFGISGAQGPGSEKDKADRKIGPKKLTKAAAKCGKRAHLVAKTPLMPIDERRAVLNGIAEDLNNLAQQALDAGLPGAAAEILSQMLGTLAHPSSFPPLDDPPKNPSKEHKAELKKQEEERKRLLQDRRIWLQASVNALKAALDLLPPDAPERRDLQLVLKRAEEDLKFARVDTKDSYRAALTQATVRKAMLKVDEKINELGLDATGDQSLMEKIATKLDRAIDEMVSEAVFLYMKSNQNDAGSRGGGRSYSEEMMRLLENGDGRGLFEKFPGLKPVIEAEVANFTRNVTEVLESTANDKQDIADAFFGGKKMKGLKNLIVADSDPHNGGRKVTILEFEGEDGTTHKVVNKPRDVRVDAKFVGNTEPSKEQKARLLEQKRAAERLKRIKEEFAKLFLPGAFKDEDLAAMNDDQLAELVWGAGPKERMRNLTDQVHQDIPKLTPEDLPAGSMSELATSLIRRSVKKRELEKRRTAERMKRIKEEFAKQFQPGAFKDEDLAAMNDDQLAKLVWGTGPQERMRNLTDQVDQDLQEKDIPDPDVEPLPTYKYLAKQPQPGDRHGHPYGWVEFVEHGSAKDCVLSEDQARNFYCQTGRQAALSILFGIEDLHQGNLMVSQGQPQLTDLEIAFSPKVFEEFPKRFEAFKRDGTPPDGGAVGSTMIDKALVQGDQQVFAGSVRTRNDRISQENPMEKEQTDNCVAVVGRDGTLKTHQDGLAADFSPEIQKGFEEILEAFADPKLRVELEKFLTSFQGVHVRYHAKATKDQLGVRRGVLMEGYADPEQSAVDKEVSGWVKSDPGIAPLEDVIAADLKKRDVAYFTRELGSGDVFHNGTTAIKREGGDDFFEDDGLEGVRAQLAILRDPKGLEFFKQCGASFLGAVRGNRPAQSQANEEVKERLKKELEGNAAAQGV
jgi:hypothetical protein